MTTLSSQALTSWVEWSRELQAGGEERRIDTLQAKTAWLGVSSCNPS